MRISLAPAKALGLSWLLALGSSLGCSAPAPSVPDATNPAPTDGAVIDAPMIVEVDGGIYVVPDSARQHDLAPDAGTDAAATVPDVRPSEGAAQDDTVDTVRNFTVVLEVLANDQPAGPATIEIVEQPRRGKARVLAGGRVIYEPAWNFVGSDQFRYRLLDGLMVKGAASATIVVRDETWVVVGDRTFAVQQLPDGGHVPSSLHERLGDGTLIGLQEEGDQSTALAGQPDAMQPVRPPDASSTWMGRGGLYGVGGGYLAGGKRRPFVLRADGRIELPDSGAAELWLAGVNQAGHMVGQAWSADLFGDALPHAVKLDSGGNAPELVEPPHTTGGSRATSIDDQGWIVGVHDTVDGERGFLRKGDEVEIVHPPGALWSQAFDIDEEKTVAGTAGWAAFSARGFLWRQGRHQEVDNHQGLETWIHGVGAGGWLLGAYKDPTGVRRALALRPVAPDGATRAPAREPLHDDIQHACGHSVHGPFEALQATTTERPPRFSRSHVSYTITLPQGEGRVGYRATQPGRVTFYLDRPVPMRLIAEDGRTIAPAHAERTGQCPKMTWLHQFEIPAASEYLVQLGPTDAGTVSLIYERGWVY